MVRGSVRRNPERSRTPRGLAGALRRLGPNLRDVDVEIAFGRDNGRSAAGSAYLVPTASGSNEIGAALPGMSQTSPISGRLARFVLGRQVNIRLPRSWPREAKMASHSRIPAATSRESRSGSEDRSAMDGSNDSGCFRDCACRELIGGVVREWVVPVLVRKFLSERTPTPPWQVPTSPPTSITGTGDYLAHSSVGLPQARNSTIQQELDFLTHIRRAGE
jgi:hypothetical protein